MYDTKWILYLSVLKIVNLVTLIDYYLIFQQQKNLKRSNKCVGLSNLSICYTQKIINKPYEKIIRLRYQLGQEIYLKKSEYILKKHGEKIDNPSIRIYIDKTENSI